MKRFDLCLAWNWEPDKDFSNLVETACSGAGLSVLHITPDNLESCLSGILNKSITFHAFLDRASESDPRFLPLVEWVGTNDVFQINPHHYACRALNKAVMHQELIRAGVCTPHTIILPSFYQQPDIASRDMTGIGNRIIIKPACGGGGAGVVPGITSWDQVLQARKLFPHDLYLIQTMIQPAILGDREAYFRVIFCDGSVYVHWWDTGTHCYTPVDLDEVCRFNLSPIPVIVNRIASACKLNLFSTEIAATSNSDFISVDYVNNPIDLRLRSRTHDGVPDRVVLSICENLVSLVKTNNS
jgi:hypothetical protein